MKRPHLPPRVNLKEVAHQATRLVKGSDIAVAYGGIVVGIAVVLAIAPDSIHDDVVLQSSTNLANLRSHPLHVLAVSAFVVSNVLGLWLVPFLMIAYAAAQRWLGRIAAITAGVFGHVGATLFVATLLVAGIRDRIVRASVAREPDVGVSYGLAAVAGMLAGYVPARWRWWYVGALLLSFGTPLIAFTTFTDVGHITALTIGFCLGWISHRAARAAAGAPAGSREGQNAAS